MATLIVFHALMTRIRLSRAATSAGANSAATSSKASAGTCEVIERAAAEHGLALQGLGAFTQPGYERGPALVLGYATPPEHAFSATIARLRAVL